MILEQLKLNKENKKIIEENEKARKLFMEKRNKYLDDLLENSQFIIKKEVI